MAKQAGGQAIAAAVNVHKLSGFSYAVEGTDVHLGIGGVLGDHVPLLIPVPDAGVVQGQPFIQPHIPDRLGTAKPDGTSVQGLIQIIAGLAGGVEIGGFEAPPLQLCPESVQIYHIKVLLSHVDFKARLSYIPGTHLPALRGRCIQ